MLLPEYTIEAERQIDTGHRVLGHEGKCRFLHGHTYTISVELMAHQLLPIGFVADFGDIKAQIDKWDHKMVLWDKDPLRFGVDLSPLMEAFGDPRSFSDDREGESEIGIVRVPFNPTAENMAWWLATAFVRGHPGFENIMLAQVEVSETESTTASYCARR